MSVREGVTERREEGKQGHGEDPGHRGEDESDEWGRGDRNKES